MKIEFKINDNTNKVLNIFTELKGINDYWVNHRFAKCRVEEDKYGIRTRDVEAYGVFDIGDKLSYYTDDLGTVKRTNDLINTVIEIYHPLVDMTIKPCGRKGLIDCNNFRVEFKFTQLS
jgi:hypothetical protein